MSEQGERIARLEEQVKELTDIKTRLLAIEKWQWQMGGGLALLQIMLAIWLKHGDKIMQAVRM